MPRPEKRRWICDMPIENEFGPLHKHQNQKNQTILLQLDEYETIRLIDQLKMTQEECAKQMNIARTTVQGIYETAREKIANAIVNGHSLRIQGGHVQICDQNRLGCGNGHCHRNQNENRRQMK